MSGASQDLLSKDAIVSFFIIITAKRESIRNKKNSQQSFL